MTETLLKHAGKCKGNLALEISQLFTFSTPSIILNPEGISGGVLEIKERSTGGLVGFLCVKCKENIGLDAKAIASSCSICGKTKSATELWVSKQFSVTCTACKDALTGDEEPDDEDLKKIFSFFLVPKNSIFVNLAELIAKQITV